MNLSALIKVLSSYPAFDIDNPIDNSRLKVNVTTAELTTELVESFGQVYGRVRIVPKKRNGTSYVRHEAGAIEYQAPAGLNGLFEPETTVQQIPTPTQQTPMPMYARQPMPGGDGVTEMYRIMYENEKANAREYKDKYENMLNEVRKLEVQLAQKPGMMDNMLNGLVQVAPALMSGGGLAGFGGGGNEQQQAPQPQKQMQPVDKRLQGICMYFSKLAEPDKDKVYQLLNHVFTNMEQIDEMLSMFQPENQ